MTEAICPWTYEEKCPYKDENGICDEVEVNPYNGDALCFDITESGEWMPGLWK